MSDLKGNRVLVTGATGFVGAHLVQHLLQAGVEVIAPVRQRRTKNWPCEHSTGLRLIEADLRDAASLKEITALCPSTVFHLGAYRGRGKSPQELQESLDTNTIGTANLLEACSASNSFIYASSLEVYGDKRQVPLTEAMCPEPISPYAISKYAGELFCQAQRRVERNRRIIVVRPSNVYGPGQTVTAIIPELVTSCLTRKPIRTTRGEQTRDFIFVDDVVHALVAIAGSNTRFEGPVNLCSAVEIAIRDLVLEIVRLTQADCPVEIGAVEYRTSEVWRMVGDNTRARSIFGWEPRVNLNEGLVRTIDWYQQRIIARSAT